MMGTQPSSRQPALFSYHIDLEQRVGADHLLRQVSAVLDLSFVIPSVRHLYGLSGNVSLDPQVILKMILLLFLYDVPSERELMEQIGVRLDFLWFLDFDLDSEIPHHSVLSKARARWGEEVFQKLFIRMLEQCVEAGLVSGSLLHIDSTIVKASASKDSVVASSPEMVNALRQAYQQQRSKLQVLPAESQESAPAEQPSASISQGPVAQPDVQKAQPRLEPVIEISSDASPEGVNQSAPATTAAKLRVLPEASAEANPPVASPKSKLPVNTTHISTTDPEAHLARNKSGVTELNYKEHRIVDDTYGVITAVATTTSSAADGSQLPGLYEQHTLSTGLEPAQVTIVGDRHYGTAANYIYCAQQEVRAHLGEASPNLEERGKLPLDQFVYEPSQDRLRCPGGHYLVLHQQRAEEQAKVYLIEDAQLCAQCPLRQQCTSSKLGRSIQRHVQAELVQAARAQAHSAAASQSFKRRRHVMEGSFADAFNNHGAKKARWRGLARQKIQSWLIATVQNLRVLMRQSLRRSKAAAAMLSSVAQVSSIFELCAANGALASLTVSTRARFRNNWPEHRSNGLGSSGLKKRPLGQHARKEAVTCA
jgi:transposase